MSDALKVALRAILHTATERAHWTDEDLDGWVRQLDAVRAVAAGAGDPPEDCPHHWIRGDEAGATALCTKCGQFIHIELPRGAGDRPPAPSDAALGSLRAAAERILDYRRHRTACEIDETDFCTCGMKVAADELRGALNRAARAVRPPPRAALTVEQLAALIFAVLDEGDLLPIEHNVGLPGVAHKLAAELLPRLGAASPVAGGPA